MVFGSFLTVGGVLQDGLPADRIPHGLSRPTPWVCCPSSSARRTQRDDHDHHHRAGTRFSARTRARGGDRRSGAAGHRHRRLSARVRDSRGICEHRSRRRQRKAPPLACPRRGPPARHERCGACTRLRRHIQARGSGHRRSAGHRRRGGAGREVAALPRPPLRRAPRRERPRQAGRRRMEACRRAQGCRGAAQACGTQTAAAEPSPLPATPRAPRAARAGRSGRFGCRRALRRAGGCLFGRRRRAETPPGRKARPEDLHAGHEHRRASASACVPARTARAPRPTRHSARAAGFAAVVLTL